MFFPCAFPRTTVYCGVDVLLFLRTFRQAYEVNWTVVNILFLRLRTLVGNRAMSSIHTVAGSLYLFISFVLFAVNALLFVILMGCKEFSNGAHRIIKNISLASMMQLVSYFAGGFMTMFDTNISYRFEKTFGALLLASWMLYQCLPNSRDCIHLHQHCLSLLFAYENRFTWYYADGKTIYLEDSEMFFDLGVIFVCFFIYLFIVFILIRTRNQSSSSAIRVQKRILIVAITSFLYESITVVLGFWGFELLPDTEIWLAITNIVWIAECGAFSFTTFLVNSSVQRRVARLFSVKNVKVQSANTEALS
ncbi:hypothetical protein QR680_018016 [Steinernema hermaphroditum]|uniref:7TM GPCR serpentine receptor class x (Srx) domain-containing protein n=1 Tax=Steinernema hermaphroditum TaxID=289476 RepID=A0AA39LPQ3_9BILA|nr:hypothetical protein QR680_018016 [Steinernema hermaphroditum]